MRAFLARLWTVGLLLGLGVLALVVYGNEELWYRPLASWLEARGLDPDNLSVISDGLTGTRDLIVWIDGYAVRYLPQLGPGIWLVLAAATLALFLYLRSRTFTDPTWPHTVFVDGVTYGIGGVIVASLAWRVLAPEFDTPLPKIFIVMVGWPWIGRICGIPVGGPLWLFQELRGQTWHPHSQTGRLFRRVWSGKRGVLISMIPREERMNEELRTLVRRRQLLATTGGLFLATVVALMYVRNHYLLYLAAIAAVAAGFAFLGYVIKELAYLAGAQFIPGAKVLEPDVPRSGKEAVRDQKAYGDANVATEAEALDLLNPHK